MAAFPKLRTEAVAQYPAGRELRFATEVVRFADGSEQRFRDAEGFLRRWIITLDRLDESEAAQIESLFLACRGRAGSFSFIDPWDGSEHADCSFENDELELGAEAELRLKGIISIRENRS